MRGFSRRDLDPAAGLERKRQRLDHQLQSDERLSTGKNAPTGMAELYVGSILVATTSLKTGQIDGGTITLAPSTARSPARETWSTRSDNKSQKILRNFNQINI